MDIVKTENIIKKYGDFVANDKIDLTVKKGEIKAIVGENGAGKSTLMNMLYGLLKPNNGKIYIRGEEVSFDTPTDAINHGIGMVHQHFKLVPSLRVYENVLLGVELKKKIKINNLRFSIPLIDKKKEKEVVQNIIETYHFKLNADEVVKHLSIGAKQKVEIVKMLYRDVDILIFDEPTAVLTPQETEAFFDTLRELKKQRKTIILITHKLGEVMAISDSVTVIKDGKKVGDRKTDETTDKELARMMVGREVLFNVDKKPKDYSDHPIIFQVNDLCTKNEEGIRVVDHVSFDIHEGEIVGIAGVEGNGQSELLDVLFGLMRATQGDVTFKGETITNAWPKDLRESSMAFIPEDRYAQGLCTDMLICDNLIAGYHDCDEFYNHGIMNKKKIKEKAADLIEEYDIRVSDTDGKVSSLSGGNAQKIIISREFDSDPDLLIAAQPTRGVDIGSIEYIHNSILELQKQGKSILLVSSELSEVMSLSDRILVMYKGEIIGERKTKETTREEIGYLMMGITEEDEKHEG